MTEAAVTPSELRCAADRIAPDHPALAQALRDVAAGDATLTPAGLVPRTDDAPHVRRRRVLRRLWREHYPMTSRTAAARLISTAWTAHQPTDRPLSPGSHAELLNRLSAAGRPLGWRRIADELDTDLIPD